MMLAKASSIPASFMTNVSVGLPGGANLKLPGSRIYENWSATIINDSDMTMRTVLEVCSDLVLGGEAPLGPAKLSDIFGRAEVSQLDREGNKIRSYLLQELYPVNVQAMDLGFDKFDEIGKFTTEFAYHYFSVKSAEDSKSVKGKSTKSVYSIIPGSVIGIVLGSVRIYGT